MAEKKDEDQVAATSRTGSSSETGQIAALTRQVEALFEKLDRMSRPRHRQNSHRHGRSASTRSSSSYRKFPNCCYIDKFGAKALKSVKPCDYAGKGGGSHVTDCCPGTGRLFVTDRRSKMQFLVDTGSNLCVFPKSYLKEHRVKTNYKLSATNGAVSTLGYVHIVHNLGLRRDFAWRFIVTDVT